MRGIGGPLLCIGDLLSDVGEEGDSLRRETSPSPSPSLPSSDLNNALPLPHPLPDLTNLFQENYDHLNSALAAPDHSWTSLTLNLCTALDTANQLVQCTNSNVASLLEKVEELQKIVKKGDSAIAAAKAVYVTPDNNLGGALKKQGLDNPPMTGKSSNIGSTTPVSSASQSRYWHRYRPPTTAASHTTDAAGSYT